VIPGNHASWGRVFAAFLLACLWTRAHAAGPYAVDDAKIGKPGECQVESWVSFANNGNFIGLTQPVCVVQIGVPIEFTKTFQTARADGDWSTIVGLQGKTILVPMGQSNVAVAYTVGTT